MIEQQPLYVPAPGRKLFAWMHPPALHSAPGTGVVICKPFGNEALCAHHSMRMFAACAAQLGCPVLSFDYAGTGDSEDVSAAANQIDVWSEDVIAAVAELRRRTGVRRIVLLGIRLGAVLASRAAERNPGAIQGLIAIAPVVSGRSYLRELRAANAFATGRLTAATSFTTSSEAGLQALGVTLSPSALSELANVDLESSSSCVFDRALIIDRADLPAAESWSQRLASLGAEANYVRLPGAVEMLMTGTTHTSVVPVQILNTVQRWLAQWPSSLTAALSDPDPSAVTCREVEEQELQLARDSVPTAGIIERPLWLPLSSNRLFGIATEPVPGEMRRDGIILLSCGADHHIGPDRLYVSLARMWAVQGKVVLRLDLAGIGDSAPRAGGATNEVFPLEAVSDVDGAVRFLRDHYDLREVTLAGVCSGAYHALRAASAGSPVDRVVLINPRNYYEKPGADPDAVQMIDSLVSAAVPGGVAMSTRHWRLLMNGRVSLSRLTAVYWLRVRLETGAWLRRIAARLHLPFRGRLASELKALVGRNVRLVFVFAKGDGGDRLLRLLLGDGIEEMGGRCHIHSIEGADHVFSGAASQLRLKQVLSDEFGGEGDEPRMPSLKAQNNTEAREGWRERA